MPPTLHSRCRRKSGSTGIAQRIAIRIISSRMMFAGAGVLRKRFSNLTKRVPTGGVMLRFLRQQAMRWLLFMGVVEFVLLLVSVQLALHLRFPTDAGAIRDLSVGLFPRSVLFS